MNIDISVNGIENKTLQEPPAAIESQAGVNPLERGHMKFKLPLTEKK